MESRLICERALPSGVCRTVIAVMAGRWRIVRPLAVGERGRTGYSVVACRECGQKYEIEELDEEAA